MFYRRKILLGLMQLIGGEVEKLRLQKLLFLYSKKKKDSEYDFIPYKYGCYSYSASADLSALSRKEIINESDNSYFKEDNIDYLKLLKPQDKTYLEEVVESYGKMSKNSLIVHTYINFPFYATKSVIAKNVLNDTLYQRVIDATPNETETILFTIGYEGVSLEKYLSKLVSNNIHVLVDVRKNPLSMKFGFSKTLLKRYCESLNVQYIHVPNVGIESNKRKKLNNQIDYDDLFEDYKLTTLKSNIESQEEILRILDKYKRIALTCFEANICQCHRLHLSESLKNINPTLKVRHI
ncbi:MAG: hypothetical protein COC06_08550 [Bacteroidales bacterium]|nr:MAG: hypothetical protein COC06_08550 [Bacteroidales bacterium]